MTLALRGSRGRGSRSRFTKMGLKPSEQHALCSIEDRITGSDPGLASMLAMFTRLTVGEALPARENIRPRWLKPGLRWQLVWPMLWLATSIALIAVALTLGNSGGQSTCTMHGSSCVKTTAAQIGW